MVISYCMCRVFRALEIYRVFELSSQFTIPYRYTWMRFFGYRWFGQTNPSRLLINVVKTFSILVSNSPRYSVFCAFHVYLVHTQICSAHSQCTKDSFCVSQYRNKFIPHVLSIWTAKFRLKIYIILHILRIYTDSFHVFSVYEHSAYSQYTYRFIWNEIIFFTAFKAILLQKKYVCVQQDRRLTSNNRSFGLSLSKKFLSMYSDNMPNDLQI